MDNKFKFLDLVLDLAEAREKNDSQNIDAIQKKINELQKEIGEPGEKILEETIIKVRDYLYK